MQVTEMPEALRLEHDRQLGLSFGKRSLSSVWRIACRFLTDAQIAASALYRAYEPAIAMNACRTIMKEVH